MADAGWEPLRVDLEADVRRVTGRLRSLSLARLAAPPPSHLSGGEAAAQPSRADAARLVAQRLVEAAQGLELRAEPGEPRWRRLPVLADAAVADQLAVAGHDLLEEMERCGPDAPVWAPGTRRTAREVVSAAAATLAATRRAI